ncbi:DUF6965 family protein [Pedobacter sp.]
MEMKEFEEFFRTCQRPEMPVYLNQATTE